MKKEYVNVFRKWVRSIPEGDYKRIRQRVIEECKITDQIFSHWKAGNSKVPNLAKPIIEEIAGKQIFKPDSDEPTNPKT